MNDSTQPPIKPCPFCGAEPRWSISTEDNDYEIQCPNMACPVLLTCCRGNEAEAIAAWNTRPLEARAETALADMTAERDTMVAELDGLNAEGTSLIRAASSQFTLLRDIIEQYRTGISHGIDCRFWGGASDSRCIACKQADALPTTQTNLKKEIANAKS